MKKLLAISFLLLGLSVHGAVFSTNILAGANNYMTNGFVLLTNRANVYSVSLLTTVSSGALVSLVDSAEWGSPTYGYYYTNASYVSRGGYATNIVANMVGYNGYTNWFTNTGYFTYSITNAANTNVLPKLATYALQPNTVTTFPADIIFEKGISALVSTNVSIILYYNQ